MKWIFPIMCALLMSGCVLSLHGCKTKEKVSENQKENVRINSTEMQNEMYFDERHEHESYAERALQTSEKDSLVEKLRERIIVDSIGNVLFKDSEYTKERYQGKGTTKTNRKESNHQSATEQANKQSQAETDTSSTAIRENTQETVKQTDRWLWFLSMLIFLLISGAFISKVTR